MSKDFHSRTHLFDRFSVLVLLQTLHTYLGVNTLNDLGPRHSLHIENILCVLVLWEYQRLIDTRMTRDIFKIRDHDKYRCMQSHYIVLMPTYIFLGLKLFYCYDNMPNIMVENNWSYL